MIDVRYSSLDEVQQYQESQLFLNKSIWVRRNGLAVHSCSTLCMISQSFLTVCLHFVGFHVITCIYFFLVVPYSQHKYKKCTFWYVLFEYTSFHRILWSTKMESWFLFLLQHCVWRWNGFFLNSLCKIFLNCLFFLKRGPVIIKEIKFQKQKHQFV